LIGFVGFVGALSKLLGYGGERQKGRGERSEEGRAESRGGAETRERGEQRCLLLKVLGRATCAAEDPMRPSIRFMTEGARMGLMGEQGVERVRGK
jgi:hypothetical protein